MNIDRRWYVLLAVAASAAAGAAVAAQSLRRHRVAAPDLEHRTALKSWEDEGGNLAPATETPAPQ